MKPSLTLALCCYKFERFVSEAVEGAFAQSYRPLEIVISDDHSPDGTWGKIVETVIRLGGFGPSDDAPWQKSDFCGKMELDTLDDLRLVLNRNEKNLGLALHENKLFELSHGEWIAFQAGDDVSAPNRMAQIAEMVESNPKIRCIECRARAVNVNLEDISIPAQMLKDQENGRKNGGFHLPSILGAGAVYHRDVYRQFGPLGIHVANEDHVLPLRASLLGEIVSSGDDILVLYRKHGDNQSGVYNPTADNTARFRQRMMFMYYQEMIDLCYADINRIAEHRLIARYKCLVRDKLFAFELLSAWHFYPEMRPALILRLIVNPRQIFLFAAKALERVFNRIF